MSDTSQSRMQTQVLLSACCYVKTTLLLPHKSPEKAGVQCCQHAVLHGVCAQRSQRTHGPFSSCDSQLNPVTALTATHRQHCATQVQVAQ
jgi:hypothetical protein